MLPFLKKNASPGLIVATRAPDENKETEKDEGNQAIDACAQDLINAIHAKDVKAVAEAIRAVFEICDSEPHVEGEHIDEEETK